MRQKERIADYWQENIGEKEINVSWDDALTHCWCCGMESFLEKAHIIPRVFGGDGSVSNLLLFCRRCNLQNPETIYPEFFWLWIKGRKKLKDEWNERYSDSTNIAKEFEFMFDSNPLDENSLNEIYSFFGEENYKRVYLEFFILYVKTKRFLSRYDSSKAAILYKFNVYSKYLLRSYKEDPMAPEVLRWFPHLNHGHVARNYNEAEELEEVERIDEIIDMEIENLM
jgi:hypothetical protein